MLTLKNKNKLVGKSVDKKNYFVSSVFESSTDYTFTLRSKTCKEIARVVIDREQTKFKSANDRTIKYYIRNPHTDVKGYITIDEIRNMDKLIDRLRNYGVK